MNLVWLRAVPSGQDFEPDERRVREYLDAPSGISESAFSLAEKLGINRRRCRHILEELVEQGLLRRQDFADIEPMYSRFPSR